MDYDSNASGSELHTDSESAESEDENGEELTPTVDAAILKTLARIKKRDPAIYDSSKNIFGGVLCQVHIVWYLIFVEEQGKVTSVSTNGHPKSKEKVCCKINLRLIVEITVAIVSDKTCYNSPGQAGIHASRLTISFS